MKIIPPSYEILAATPNMEKLLELAGRVCYKSEDRITDDSAADFIGRMHASKHESVLEHAAITVRIICDRGVSHELVRHRLCSFSQESTRYVNYGKKGIQIIKPEWIDDDWVDEDWDFLKLNAVAALRRPSEVAWMESVLSSTNSYLELLERGWTPQQARSVLPNSLKTEVVMTANPREWRHIFKLRCSPQAHPQMREIMLPMRTEFVVKWPSLFGEEA